MTLPTVSKHTKVLERAGLVVRGGRPNTALVELIWQMWTDPEHLKAWYGPDGATIRVAKMDVRVGGSRLFCIEMRSPNGPRQMWFTGCSCR